MDDRYRWRPILFDCPRTGRKAQAMFHEEASSFDGTNYETISCPACAGIHFVNARTGAVLGAQRSKPDVLARDWLPQGPRRP